MALGSLLAQNLKRLRDLKGFSQETLAEASGISATQIARLETRKSWISEEAGERIAEALGVDPFELFRSNTPPVGAKAELIALLDDLDENILGTLLTVARANVVRSPAKVKDK